jgi:hypothetical protein
MVTHTGGCHCGRVRFEVTAPTKLQVKECNCSKCAKLAYQHLTVPTSQFGRVAGADMLTSYSINTGVAKHLFCSVRGVKSFYVPRSHPDGFSVNVRCLDPGTVEEITVQPINGQNWESEYPEGRGQFET